jgi:hypothetical protein
VNSFIWNIVWSLLPRLLGLSKDTLGMALSAISQANNLKHPDGTDFSGVEKQQYVFDTIKSYVISRGKDLVSTSTLNTLIEFALSYAKSKGLI